MPSIPDPNLNQTPETLASGSQDNPPNLQVNQTPGSLGGSTSSDEKTQSTTASTQPSNNTRSIVNDPVRNRKEAENTEKDAPEEGITPWKQTARK